MSPKKMNIADFIAILISPCKISDFFWSCSCLQVVPGVGSPDSGPIFQGTEGTGVENFEKGRVSPKPSVN